MAHVSVADEIKERVKRQGPLAFSDVQQRALYGPAGFFSQARGAGRRRDFLTSPEVGPLFGAVLANAFDTWWSELGEPDPFVVIDAGAGPATLCRAVIAAYLRCGPALRFINVEVSDAARELHRDIPGWVDANEFMGPMVEDEGEMLPQTGTGPRVTSLGELPSESFVGVVIANELLDNIPIDIVVRSPHGWSERRVGVTTDDELEYIDVDLPDDSALDVAARFGSVDIGTVLPLQSRAHAWVRHALARLQRGRLVVLDYARPTTELGAVGMPAWLRAYAGHQRVDDLLAHLGDTDITCDVDSSQLMAASLPNEVRTQREFLGAHGIDGLVTEGQAIWQRTAATGSLEAMKARSRVREAEALLDPDGLGGFGVFEWIVT